MSEQGEEALGVELEKLGALNADGELVWPDDPQKAAEVARLLMGAKWVGKSDAWLETGRGFFLDSQGEEVQALNARMQREARWREVLATLSPEQREAAMGVMQYAMHGALFSFLVALDQPRSMSLRIAAYHYEDDEPRLVAELLPDREGPLQMGDLHDECHWWIETFSRYGETARGDRLDDEMRRRLQMAAPGEHVEHTLSEEEAEREREMGRSVRAMLNGMRAATQKRPKPKRWNTSCVTAISS